MPDRQRSYRTRRPETNYSLSRSGESLIREIDGALEIKIKKYIYIYTLGKPGNFHILIKLDNSICIEDEDSKPIEHVRSSSRERERKNETRNDRQREGKKWSKINFNQLLPRFSLIYLLIHTCLVL